MTKLLPMLRQFWLFAFFLSFSLIGLAQTTLNTTLGGAAAFSNNNGSGTVTFNFANNSGGPVNITTVEGISGSSGASTGQLWIRTAGPINASTSAALGNISAANGWTLAASGTFTSVANTTTLTTQTFISGASVSIPAGANYGMAVVCFLTATPTTGTQRYHTMVSPNIPTTTFTGGGCTITMGTNISWGGGAPPTTPVNHPRAWLGKITFVPAGPCIAPPTAGTVTTTVSTPCPNTNFTLSLTGGTGGTGQTYQWEISPDNITWSPITGATNASLTTTQVSSNYYRCVVTCSSQSSTTASLLVTTNGVPLSGNYTINSAAPTAGTNFASFTAFANVINCAGVSGPVTVDVVSGSGPYTEQVIFNQFPGSSAVNTVTINGNGETIQFNSANSALPSTIEFSGTDYTTVNNLIFEGQGATYAMACHLWNDANYNNFNNCTFTSPANGTSTTQVPFSISGSQTSATTTGLSGSNNIVTGCTMNSGYYNTCFVGNSASPNTGNQLINCNIRDQYFYASYNLYQNGMIIRGNTIERPTRTTLSTFYGIYMSTGCVGMLVEMNRIRNPFGSTPTNTGTAYGVYLLVDGTSGNENRIYNNLISDFNSNGATYGLYLTGADYVKAYHNTISFDQTSSTAGSAYGIYNSGTVGGIDIKNNIISITKGGTGTKWGLYYTGTFPASDNNVVNVVPSATNYFGYYLTLNYVTKSAFNTASGKDGNSVEADPIFSNPSLGDYQPTNVSVNNAGTPIAAVTTDILGNSRSLTNPDPGCYEFNLSSLDMSLISLASPTPAYGCYTGNELVSVVVKNSGVDPIDFSLNPVTITMIVNGPISSVVSEVLTSGTLGVGLTQTVVLNPSIDLTIDGTYNFSGSVSVAGDANPSNDNLTPTVNVVVGVVPGTISMNLNNPICVSYPPTFTLTGQFGGTKQWQISYAGAGGPWNNVGSGTSTFNPGTITQDYWVRVESNCNTNYAYTNTIAVTVNNPTMVNTVDGQRCGTGTVDLSATAMAGASVNWYAAPSGGLALASGTNTFTTPSISSTTTYYAAPAYGSGLQTVSGGNTWNQYTTVGSFQSTTITGAVMIFDVLTPTVLGSVDIYPSSAVGTPFTIEVRQTSGSGALIASYSGVTTVSNSGTPTVAQTVNCNLNLPPGTGYVIGFASNPGCWRGNVTNFPYPFSLPGVVNITGSSASGSAASPTLIYQYYLYNWKMLTGCEGVRSPVVATVNTAPAINATAPTQICEGQTASLNVTSTDPDYVYTWQPGNLSGASQTVSPSVNTTYTVTAYNPNTLCQLFANLPMTVNTNPTLSSATASPSSVNPGCNTSVTLTATTSAPTTILVGNASATTTTSATGVTPYSSFYESARIQYLITASELTSLGFSAGTLSSIGFDVTATSAFNQTGYTIKMGHTAATALSGYATIIGSLQTVYGPVLMTPPPLGVNTYNFGTPFSWNGTDNVIIEICHDNDPGNTCVCYSTAGTVRYTATTPNTVYGTYNDNALLCGTGIGTLTVNTNTRPNIYLNGIAGQITTKTWDPGSLAGNSVSVTPGATTTYTVTCTNATTGCTTSGNVTVTMNASATISGLNPSYSVAASAVTMTGTPSGGVFSGPGVSGNTFDPAIAGVGTHTISYLPSGYCVPATATVIVNPSNSILNLKCYIEGFYIGSGAMQPVLNNQGQSNPLTDCDTVVVELHDGTTPYATAHSFTGVLQTNGTLTCTYPASAQGNSYYIVVNHRNAMQTWSASPVTIGAVTNYDFSSAVTQAYGDNQVQVETGVYAFYSGDMNQDLSIDAFDYLMMDPDIYNGAGGWLPTDLNGDGSVDAFDYLIYDPNGYNGITVQSP